jgi:hypothetical protein
MRGRLATTSNKRIMNTCIIIDIRPTTKSGHIVQVKKVERIINGIIDDYCDMKDDPVTVMAALCEALICVIRAADKENIKKDFESMEDCINHIQKGFMDPDYEAGITNLKK